MELVLENIDDRTDVLVNGRRVFSCGLGGKCSKNLDRWLERGSKNTIELRLYNVGGPYHYRYTLYRDGKVHKSDSCGMPGNICDRWFPLGKGRCENKIVAIQLPD